MYSMSTETLQTQTYVKGGRIHFLPYAPGVLYEFLPDGAPDDPSLLLGANALAVGETYCMVVSDAYGLRRYQTEGGKILPRRITGNCYKHQKMLTAAVKRARILALVL